MFSALYTTHLFRPVGAYWLHVQRLRIIYGDPSNIYICKQAIFSEEACDGTLSKM